MNLTSQIIAKSKDKVELIEQIFCLNHISNQTVNRFEFGKEKREHVFLNKKNISKKKFVVNGVAFHMIFCPKGSFEIEGRVYSSDEVDNLFGTPKYGIFIKTIKSPFFLGEAEVTQELFEAVMGYNPSNFQGSKYPNSKQRPVESVYWHQAMQFCNKLSIELGLNPYYMFRNEFDTRPIVNQNANGFRLPTTEELMYASMSDRYNRYHNQKQKYAIDWKKSHKLEDFAWFKNNSKVQTHAVKTKLPNRKGFYDLNGNVKELTSDAQMNFNGTSLRVNVCGGGYNSSKDELNVLTISDSDTAESYWDVGFRICMNQ
jgi:formylglycine-generating enzyme required for sulfatase activity